MIKSKNCKDDFSRRISVLCGWCLRDMRPLVFIYHHIFPRQNCTLHVGDSDSNLHVKYCIAKAVQYCSLSVSVISPWFKYHNLSTIVNKCHKGFLITLLLTSSVFTKKLSLPLLMSQWKDHQNGRRNLLSTIFKTVEGFLFLSSIINAFVFVLVCLHVFVFVILVVMSSLPFTLNNLPKKSHVSGNILCCMLSTNLLYLSLNYLKFILTVIFKIPRLLKSDHHRVGSH